MDNSKIDLKKKAEPKPAKASPDDVKAELSDEQLSDVSGGNLLSHCATGTHYKTVILP